MNKKFCDRCKKEIPLSHDQRAFVKFGIGDGINHFNLGQNWKTTKGKQIVTISGGNELCLDCYQEFLEFLCLREIAK